MIEHAPAKINVCLFVGPRRDDGRHELVTVFQAVSLEDVVELERSGIDEVVCPGVEGPNLAVEAIEAFRAHTGWDGPPVRVTITKSIPVAAGLAGGSADAGATLRLLARHSGLGGDDELRRIATLLGADVPAQVRPGRYLGTGAGERLEPLPAIAPYGVLVLPLAHQLSTGDVFARARELGLVRDRADLAACLEHVRAGLPSLTDGLAINDLQDAAIDLCPPIAEALEQVRAAGADHALVSGSGPTVLGLFRDERSLAEAAAQLGAEACQTVAR